MARLNVRIGINPISWTNDDLPQLGGDTPLETCLSEGAEIGYEGFELGNKFPKDPEELKAKVAGYGAVVVPGVVAYITDNDAPVDAIFEYGFE